MGRIFKTEIILQNDMRHVSQKKEYAHLLLKRYKLNTAVIRSEYGIITTLLQLEHF